MASNISCCRLNRSPHFSHSNGRFARSATVLLLLTVPQCGIWLLCRFKSCGRLNFCPHRSQDICKASLSTAVILRLFVSYMHIYMHTFIHTYIHTFPSGVVHKVNIPSSCASALARRQVLNWMPSSHNGTNSEKPPLYIHTYISPIRCIPHKCTQKCTRGVPSSCASALARRQVLNYMSSSHTASTVKNRLCIYFPHICCYKPPISQYNR